MKIKPITRKMCGICLKDIDITKDDYCHLEDFHLGKFYMEGYYHTKCYNDKIKGQEDMFAMKKQTMALLKKAGELLGTNEDKVVKIQC